ncbi:MAG: hypothetical protein NC251_10750 [Lachnoclostridium sp.]|nr:hypothetical protein [Lachnospira sp.]MCM1248898.1 hypothetical protein [Lachnoclostridium sp.]
MTFYDWNHNGAGDFSEPVPCSSGISIFGAVFAIILGLFSAAGILAFLGGENDLSMILALLLWLICSGVLSVWFDNIGL